MKHLLSIFALLGCTSAWCADPNILGVKLGKSLAEATNMIKKAEPDLIFNKPDAMRSPVPNETWLISATGLHNDPADKNQTVTIYAAGAPEPNPVTGITRKFVFMPGKEPTLETIISSLTTTYGAPADRIGTSTLVWFFDEKDKPLPKTGQRNVYSCDVRPINVAAYLGNTVDWTRMEGCGTTVIAKLNESYQAKGLCNGVEVTLSSRSYERRALAALEKHIQTKLNAFDAAQKKKADGVPAPKF